MKIFALLALATSIAFAQAPAAPTKVVKPAKVKKVKAGVKKVVAPKAEVKPVTAKVVEKK